MLLIHFLSKTVLFFVALFKLSTIVRTTALLVVGARITVVLPSNGHCLVDNIKNKVPGTISSTKYA